ncbi:MAG: pantoate--beta-alanine ligase, partial [Pseudomonadota bacterium]
GALHAGHISLVELAKTHAEAVVVSIFVNPTQFSPNEDLSKYPRTEAQDIAKLEAAGAAIAYIPSVDEIYSDDAATTVHVEGITKELCGEFRQGHFDGVATIVTKLFMQSLPDFAIFGEKDYQQLCVIRKLVEDLDINVEIVAAPTLRETDGLAMSSRNVYLDPEQRTIASNLHKILQATAEGLRAGGEVEELLAKAKEDLLEAGFNRIDYLELRDAATLKKANNLDKPTRLPAAVYLGKTRLIDNIGV